MQRSIKEIAKESGVIPGQVISVLSELGIGHSGELFELEEEVLDLVKESLVPYKGSKKVIVTSNKTPREVAFLLGISVSDLQKTLITKLKVMATLTTVLKPEVVVKLFEHYGYTLEWGEIATPKEPSKRVPTSAHKKGLHSRSPVVTIMGHVDHGKTTLLDYIRKSNVAEKEHGGITQHIGAYQVELPEGKITFLDTPGHEAFTAMRARGAHVTDIAVLVVSADDGIMPQTIEAINHAKNAGVPIIVAINKIDKPGANPERVMSKLPEHELVPEAYGGQIITCPVSAFTGEGVPELLEMILLQADILQLTADPKAPFKGVVIEAKLEKGRGPVATILVEEGALKSGDAVVSGICYGKIKAMNDYKGELVKFAGPAMPVEILGMSAVPKAGDLVSVAKNEKEARAAAESQQDRVRLQEQLPSQRKFSLRDLKARLQEGKAKDLNLIVKADVQGSLEAVKGLLDRIENSEVKVKIVHSGVGSLTESDLLLASAASAICVGFNVRLESGVKKEAERLKVEVRSYKIIYELIEDIEAAVKGMLEPKFEEQYLGTAQVRVLFKLTKVGKVAGSHVTDGKIKRNSLVRVKRGNEIVYEGEIASLKHLKSDVSEMAIGQDCGIQFSGWEDFQEGDLVYAHQLVEVNG